MPELVALDLPAGQDFVDALETAWDDGNAVLPLDPRLARPAAVRLLDALRPTSWSTAPERTGGPAGYPTDPGDALVIATSGTTGDPKGVVLTHEAVRASALATSARLGVDPRHDRWLACLPLAHIGGLSVVTRALITGTPCTVLPRFDPTEVERQARSGATLVSLVATALGRTDAARLPGGASGRSRSPRGPAGQRGHHLWNDRDRARESSTTAGRSMAPKFGSTRRRRWLTGPAGADGPVGEVLVRGPMVLHSYRDGTDPRRPGGWYPTGDAGRLEPDGTLTVFGRIAEVIVTGGEKVWPVAGRAAVGRPSREWDRSRCGSGPTPSGASGWWPGWCRRPRRRPRSLGGSAGAGGRRAGALGRPPRAGDRAVATPDPERQGPTDGADLIPDESPPGGQPVGGTPRPVTKARRWRCTGHHRR